MLVTYRLGAAGCGISSIVLLAFGLAGSQRLLCSAALLASVVGAMCVVLWRMEATVERVIAGEMARSRARLAAAVAEALADELEQRSGPPPRLTSVRN